jgi:YHS domain-containing protein
LKKERTEIVTSVCACQSCVNRREFVILEIYRGKELIFCQEECVSEFKEDPEKFIKSDHFKLSFEELPESQLDDTVELL